jgi:hypothetical protein
MYRAGDLACPTFCDLAAPANECKYMFPRLNGALRDGNAAMLNYTDPSQPHASYVVRDGGLAALVPTVTRRLRSTVVVDSSRSGRQTPSLTRRDAPVCPSSLVWLRLARYVYDNFE